MVTNETNLHLYYVWQTHFTVIKKVNKIFKRTLEAVSYLYFDNKTEHKPEKKQTFLICASPDFGSY